MTDLASGTQGALRIAGHLLDRFGEDSFEFIIDEGGSEVRRMYGTTFALPGTAEKVVCFSLTRLTGGISRRYNHCVRQRRTFLCSARTHNYRPTLTNNIAHREEPLGTCVIY